MQDFRARFAKAFPNAPAGMPNQYTIRAYADAYVIAEALRRAGKDVSAKNIVAQLNTIDNFIAGKDANFKYAAAIGLPRSFSATDHQGTKVVAPVVDPVARERLWEILDVSLRDRRQAWLLDSDGHYSQLSPEGAIDGPEGRGTHQVFMDLTRRRQSQPA